MSAEKQLHEHEHQDPHEPNHHDHDEHCDCGCCGDDCEDEVVELYDDAGKAYKFVHIGGTQYDDKWFLFFLPAENIDGLDEESVVIFEAGEENEDGSANLKPVEDEDLLDKVYDQFCREMDEQTEAMEAEELEGGCGCDENCDECTCEDDCDDCPCGCDEPKKKH